MTGTTIVRDGRFVREIAPGSDITFTALEEIAEPLGFTGAIDVMDVAASDALLAGTPSASAIRIAFPSSADGRGNSLAAGLRARGYEGVLRASGMVLAEQYPLALRVGFDELEIPDALATRQPEALWQISGARQVGYLERLSGVSRVPGSDPVAEDVREAA